MKRFLKSLLAISTLTLATGVAAHVETLMAAG